MELLFFVLVVILFSIIIHEVAHGSVAYYLGDPTAKNAGRLTLNPLKHIDPFGSVIIPLFLLAVQSPFLVGWAKPVPVNPFNFRDRKWGDLKVAFAGPASNLLIGLFFSLLDRFVPAASPLFLPFALIAVYNFLLAVFNLIPIPPLDGAWILFSFLPEKYLNAKLFLQRYGTYILILLIFFGLGWVSILAASLFSLISGQNFLF